MKTRTKIILTIVLAAVYWIIMQAALDSERHASVSKVGMTVAELHAHYEIINDRFFNNKLPKDVVIDYSEKNPENMATTTMGEDGLFHVSLNPVFAKSARVGEYLLLHESCHIAKWDDKTHGPEWRTCMLQIDAQGGFREIFIDGYREKMP